MRIFMLGWEFPPFLAGGLGTACHGLTKGLVNHGHEVLFVLPQATPDNLKTHVQLLGPHTLKARAAHVRLQAAAGTPAPTPFGSPQVAAGVPALPDIPTGIPSGIPDSTGILPEVPVTSHPYPGIDLGDTLTKVVKRLHAAA